MSPKPTILEFTRHLPARQPAETDFVNEWFLPPPIENEPRHNPDAAAEHEPEPFRFAPVGAE
jgi:hypothetical protein